MATSYPSSVTPSGGEAASSSASAPIIRTIGLSDLHQALRLGWEDFKAVPSHAIILCVIYPILGLVLARTVLGYSVLPLLFPLAAGFALLGPFAALGLYELSRRRESGEGASAWDALEVLLVVDVEHRPRSTRVGERERHRARPEALLGVRVQLVRQRARRPNAPGLDRQLRQRRRRRRRAAR